MLDALTVIRRLPTARLKDYSTLMQQAAFLHDNSQFSDAWILRTADGKQKRNGDRRGIVVMVRRVARTPRQFLSKDA